MQLSDLLECNAVEDDLLRSMSKLLKQRHLYFLPAKLQLLLLLFSNISGLQSVISVDHETCGIVVYLIHLLVAIRESKCSKVKDSKLSNMYEVFLCSVVLGYI